ncbi:MAG: putative toxin-antitoxin system toxin component, PIN family [Acidobacteriaceae bacterium]
MIRVVLDTNILISALLSPQGPPAQVFLTTIIDPDTQLCVSGDIFAEYEEVIRCPRLNRSGSEIVATLRTIREKGFWVKPTEKVQVCSDPDDDIFLECAQAVAAHYLVTGNAKDFPATWSSTQIVTARQFLDAVV